MVLSPQLSNNYWLCGASKILSGVLMQTMYRYNVPLSLFTESKHFIWM